MPRRWLRNKVNNRLIATVTKNDAATAPTGFDYVLESAIRAQLATGPISPGSTFTGTTYIPPSILTGSALPDARRKELALRILKWALAKRLPMIQAKERTRATGFARVLEAHTRAILINANLMDNAGYGIIRTELAKDPERFIWKFSMTQWYSPPDMGFYGPQIDGSTHLWLYRTSGDIDANDSANISSGPSKTIVTMTQTSIDRVAKIVKLTV